ncbi:hypothetical protein Ait01nite_081780 [Actinoplanes italicus]|nr:hypothetical protein Ait01nite_081780 [Actinoplanes italicus]
MIEHAVGWHRLAGGAPLPGATTGNEGLGDFVRTVSDIGLAHHPGGVVGPRVRQENTHSDGHLSLWTLQLQRLELSGHCPPVYLNAAGACFFTVATGLGRGSRVGRWVPPLHTP